MTGEITREQLAAMSGLEIMQGAASGMLPLAAMGELMGFRIVAVERGHVTFEGETGPRLLNPLGIVHGGFALTLIDSAAGCALHSDLEPGISYASVETKVNFVRPIAADLGTVTCEGRLISRGRQIATAEAHLRAPDGKLLAHGTSTLIILPAR